MLILLSDDNLRLNGPLFVQSPPDTPATLAQHAISGFYDVISEVKCVSTGGCGVSKILRYIRILTLYPK